VRYVRSDQISDSLQTVEKSRRNLVQMTFCLSREEMRYKCSITHLATTDWTWLRRR
jgi:hypothetical protein